MFSSMFPVSSEITWTSSPATSAHSFRHFLPSFGNSQACMVCVSMCMDVCMNVEVCMYVKCCSYPIHVKRDA